MNKIFIGRQCLVTGTAGVLSSLAGILISDGDGLELFLIIVGLILFSGAVLLFPWAARFTDSEIIFYYIGFIRVRVKYENIKTVFEKTPYQHSFFIIHFLRSYEVFPCETNFKIWENGLIPRNKKVRAILKEKCKRSALISADFKE